MPVFSANSIGAASIKEATANTNYVGTAGLSRAMYESTMNDMTIFEAMLNNDFHEIRGLREGTILESELESLNEASVSGAIATIRAAMTKVWEKIKGAFQALYRNITAFIATKSKKWVAKNKDSLTKKANDPSLMKGMKAIKYSPYKEVTFNHDVFGNAKRIAIDSYGEGQQGEALLKQTLEKTASSVKVGSVDSYRADVMAAAFPERSDMTGADIARYIPTMIANLEKGSQPIKDLRTYQKNADKEFKQAMTYLKADEKATGRGKDKDVEGSENVKRAMAAAKTFQKAMTIMCSAQMAVVKQNIAQDWMVLRRIGNYKVKAEAALMKENEDIADAEEDQDIAVVNDFLNGDEECPECDNVEGAPEDLADTDDDGVDVEVIDEPSGDASEAVEINSEDQE